VFWLRASDLFVARKHNHDKSKKALFKINGYISGYDVDREYATLQTEIQHEEQLQTGATFFELFKGSNGRRTAIATLAIAAQPLFGAAITFGFNAYYFAAAGIRDPFLSTLIIFLVLNFIVVVSFYTTERVGRRPMYIFGAAAMTVLKYVV
jgi:SP family general alpha glucoside:H+ symporter-like MFS transporter